MASTLVNACIENKAKQVMSLLEASGGASAVNEFDVSVCLGSVG